MAVSVDTLITRSVNRIGAVHPSLKEYTIELIKRCYKEGILIQISSGYRSNEDQAYIYGQGRPQYMWNGKKYGSVGRIVSNAQPGTSVHNYGLAIDYFLVSDDGLKSLWTVNDKWKRVGAIAKAMGFEWGGDWTSFKDYPHLQFNRGLTISQLKQGLKPAFPQLIIEEEKKVSKQQLTPAQEKVRQEAIDLGITDGKNPFREVNQHYVWNALLPLARELAELKKKA
ncbi:M15 family metallopeptidase [Psychrobacillus sp.]|uniref:M15 family metallopeptidase n=1 Tax=Psychrobacillus sp. TaxID=1871623 RepID=UPI0028BF09ED|nr:M15 family metallopeptidase [Psychrobacillus sp.]